MRHTPRVARRNLSHALISIDRKKQKRGKVVTRHWIVTAIHSRDHLEPAIVIVGLLERLCNTNAIAYSTIHVAASWNHVHADVQYHICRSCRVNVRSSHRRQDSRLRFLARTSPRLALETRYLPTIGMKPQKRGPAISSMPFSISLMNHSRSIW